MRFPNLSGRFLLAPMSGVTDIAFRILCKYYGAAMTYTEFCSAEGVVRGSERSLNQFRILAEERPVGVQLFGNNPVSVREAASLAEEADVIDLNLGCPAWHVLRQGAGSAMLEEPKRVKELVRAVTEGINTPFTVKIRLGISDKKKNFLEVSQRCVDAGAAAVTLHAKTTKQGCSGKADWNAIKELKEALEVPVIGNGDVWSPEDAKRMLEETGCDYVMIGRAAKNNPFIFTQANQLLKQGSYDEQSDRHKLGLFSEYLSLAKKHKINFFRIKGHALSLTRGVERAKELRTAISKAGSTEELQQLVEAHNG